MAVKPKEVITSDDIKVLISKFEIFVDNTVRTQNDHENRLRAVEKNDEAIMQLIQKIDSKADLAIEKLRLDIEVMKGEIMGEVKDIKVRTNVFSGLQVAFTSLVGVVLAMMKK